MKQLGKLKCKGDVASIIYVIIFLAVVGIVIFLISHVNNEIFSELETSLNETGYAGTEAADAAYDFKTSNQSRLWDYAFLGIFMGCMIAIGISAYAVKISPIFYWVYGLMSLFVLAMGVLLSNAWQALAAEPEFATTLTRFTIMNTMLGTWFPTIVTAIIILFMIVLFGKSPGQEGYG